MYDVNSRPRINLSTPWRLTMVAPKSAFKINHFDSGNSSDDLSLYMSTYRMARRKGQSYYVSSSGSSIQVFNTKTDFLDLSCPNAWLDVEDLRLESRDFLFSKLDSTWNFCDLKSRLGPIFMWLICPRYTRASLHYLFHHHERLFVIQIGLRIFHNCLNSCR